LIIGCGCRGQALAAELLAGGHAVRGTSRDSSRMLALEAAGIEAFTADPDRVGTIVPALEQVTIACVLLGSAVGDPERIAALHGRRLEMLLEKMIDTTVRGVVYESAGKVASEALERGSEVVSAVCWRSRIPYALIDADPTDHGAWVKAATGAVERVTA
jgi:uncharacterized protein YbjT (DUF2867 family)